MSLSRRHFLRSSAAAALFAGLAAHPLQAAFAQEGAQRTGRPADDGSGYYQVPQEAKTERAFYFTKSTFEPHLNTDFKSRIAVVATTLRLIDIEDCPTKPATESAGECFSLTFRADRELSSLTTMHVFEHAALGEFPLFVSPTKKMSDPDGIYYTAVINQRIEKGPRTEIRRSPLKAKTSPE